MLPSCIVRERNEIAERTAVVLESLSPTAAIEFRQSLDEEIAKIRSEIRRAAEKCANRLTGERGSEMAPSGYELYSA
jgi:hypothetical protein